MKPAGRWHARRLLAVAGLALGGLVVLGGLLHLPVARPLLAHLGAFCPVRTASAAEVDAVRGPALAALRGEAAAKSRPALGLRLDATTAADVRGWAEHHGVSCAAPAKAPHTLACADVPPEALGLPASHGPVPDVALAFDAKGVLVAVDALRRGLSPREAAAAGTTLLARLSAELGAPGERSGDWTAEHLAGPLHTSIVRFRFRDYVATVTATHVPGSGVLLRQQYLSVS
ncbi:MAG: hypothetical protein ABW221_12390 [Vicinamibacteria bacterium]